MTTSEFWNFMWSFPWYKRIWFGIIDDAVIFLTIWWLWAFMVGWALYPIIKYHIMMKIATRRAIKNDKKD